MQYLNFMVFDPKKDILSQHFSAIAHKMVGMKYTLDVVIRAFEYYATSCSLFNRLKEDFQLRGAFNKFPDFFRTAI